jgi:hypothetical protein
VSWSIAWGWPRGRLITAKLTPKAGVSGMPPSVGQLLGGILFLNPLSARLYELMIELDDGALIANCAAKALA